MCLSKKMIITWNYTFKQKIKTMVNKNKKNNCLSLGFSEIFLKFKKKVFW